MTTCGKNAGRNKVPVVGGADLVAQQHRSAANCLLDDPAALRHTGDELQHIVPLGICCWVLHITLNEPAIQTNNTG